jgi:hypothetical protein
MANRLLAQERRLLSAREKGEATAFLRWLTLTHRQRLHAHRHTTGYGYIYQERFKSFPIEQDQSMLNVLRYVGRNALPNLPRRRRGLSFSLASPSAWWFSPRIFSAMLSVTNSIRDYAERKSETI